MGGADWRKINKGMRNKEGNFKLQEDEELFSNLHCPDESCSSFSSVGFGVLSEQRGSKQQTSIKGFNRYLGMK
jgi:hypothetical protein